MSAAAPKTVPWRSGGFRFPRGPLQMEGTYRSHCVVLPLAADRVKRMLPPGLDLAPQSLTPPGEHPVLLMFGHHQGVRPTWLRTGGGQYHELVVAVPFLRRPGTRDAYEGPFAYMPRLYLDNWFWVVLGWFYGYAKVRARIRTDSESYAVESLLGARPIVSGSFASRGNAAPAGEFPFFAQVAPVFEQPFASRVLGITICSVMTFHLERASIQAVDARIELEDAFVRGLPVRSFQAPGIDSGPLGAFRIEVPWTLSSPFSCGSLEPETPGETKR